ncbi:hypothetical protein [Hydrogenophaga sp. MI9]|uniref:hypothetical protein n=1 Tax=Hydrogenophaga sp. MI9 TaxID=3453719 RepID=UPI003EE8C118
MNNDKTYTLAHGGYALTQDNPERLGIAGTVPHSAFLMLLELMNGLALDKAAIVGDNDLSSVGRQNKLQPKYSKVWDAVCFAHATLAAYQQATAEREARLLAVPTLHDGATAVAIEDVETRQWWRSLSLGDRNEVMAEITKGGEEAATKYSRLSIALMRSPTPLPLERETEFFRGAWAQAARVANPGEAVTIDREKEAAQWAVRGLAQLVGILHGLTGWSRAALLAFLVADPKRIGAAAALGYGKFDVARAQQAQQQTDGRIPALA